MSNASVTRRDAVIVGGGIMGTSTAYHLARAGVTDVDRPGVRATSAAARRPSRSAASGPCSPTRRTSPWARGAWRRSAASTPRWVSTSACSRSATCSPSATPTTSPVSSRASPCRTRWACRSRLIGAAEARRLCPYLAEADVVAAVWSPGRRLRPTRRRRARLRRRRDRAGACRSAPRPRSTAIDASAGRSGPRPHRRRQLPHARPSSAPPAPGPARSGRWWASTCRSSRCAARSRSPRRSTPRPPRVPFTIDYSTTAYFHGAEDGGLLMGWADPLETPGFGRDVSTDWHQLLRAALAAVRPRGRRGADRQRLGRAVRDDPGLQRHHRRGRRRLPLPLRRRLLRSRLPPGPRRRASAVADLYLGRPPAVDVSAFTLERFAQPAVRTELGII